MLPHQGLAPARSAGADLRDVRVLIIDDRADMRENLRTQLSHAGIIYCDLAPTITAAIDRIARAQGRYELILCDYHLGEGADGQENAPSAESAAAISPTVAVTVELPVAVILQADAKAIEDRRNDLLHLIGDAAANAARGRSVVAYEWRSHRDGVLSTAITATLPISQLAPGPHIITFRVQDDQGHWSQPDSALWVNLPAWFVYLPATVR